MYDFRSVHEELTAVLQFLVLTHVTLQLNVRAYRRLIAATHAAGFHLNTGQLVYVRATSAPLVYMTENFAHLVISLEH
jgi:hypothetical protein